MNLHHEFGDIDIYLFDQLLKGRIRKADRILDAGCGSGRNLVYLLRQGFDVSAVDPSPHAVAEVRELVSLLSPPFDPGRIRQEPVESTTFPDATFSVVISNAVLHFARDEPHFNAMLDGCWRVLAGGGMLFTRLATTITIAERVRPLGNNRFKLPDGSERYLATETALMEWTQRHGGQLLEPLKTTLVQDQRAMTTWVVRPPHSASFESPITCPENP
jgi:SAM-dependent methyltransferase